VRGGEEKQSEETTGEAGAKGLQGEHTAFRLSSREEPSVLRFAPFRYKKNIPPLRLSSREEPSTRRFAPRRLSSLQRIAKESLCSSYNLQPFTHRLPLLSSLPPPLPSMKRQKVPRNILAGMIRKQGERSDKADKIARDAGIVQAKKKKVKKSFSEQNRRDNRISGPSPSIGFMRGGVLSVKKT